MSYYTDDFETGTNGVAPSGWTRGTAGTALVSTAQAHGGTKSVALTAADTDVYLYRATADTNRGDTTVSAWFRASAVSNFIDPELWLRATAPTTTPSSGYRLYVGMNGSDDGIRFTLFSGGVSALIGGNFKPASYGSLWSNTQWYYVEFSAQNLQDGTGVKLAVYVQRSSDSAWLTAAGTWVAGLKVACHAALDYPPSHGSGYYLFGGYAVVGGYVSSGLTLYVDDVTFADLPARSTPASVAPAGDEVEWVLDATSAVAGTAADGTHDKDKLYDGSYVGSAATFYQAAGECDTWAGIDLGSGVTGTLGRVHVAPSCYVDGSGQSQEAFLQGATIEAANSTGGPWTQLGTLGDRDYLFRDVFTEMGVAAGSAYRYFRVRAPLDALRVAELRFAGSRAGRWKPARPRLSPAAGRFAAGTTVAITCDTTGAAVYYTTDGSTPTTGSTLYTAPVALGAGTTAVKAIASHASGTVTTSGVSSGVFDCGPRFAPSTGAANGSGSSDVAPQDWYDDAGRLIEAHQGGVFPDPAGTGLYWYGGSMSSGTVSPTPGSEYTQPRGLWGYHSGDGYNWTALGLVVPPAPSDWVSNNKYLGVQIRNHVLVNPAPADPDKKYVQLVHLMSQDLLEAWVGICTAPAAAGPWAWRNYYHPDAHTVFDLSAFLDDDGKAYLVFDADSHATVRMTQLDPATDWTSFVASSTVTLDSASNREAPVLFARTVSGTKWYFLVSSGLSYYSVGNTAVKYKAATTIAGLNAENWASVWSSAPASTSVAYNAQPTDVFRVFGHDGLVLACDWWDAGAPTPDLVRARHAWYPLAPSAFGAGTLSINPATATWDLSSLPASGGLLLKRRRATR